MPRIKIEICVIRAIRGSLLILDTSSWQDKSVLITGATGFVGSHLAERLVNEGARVRVFVRQPDRLLPVLRDRVEVVQGDLLQPDGTHCALYRMCRFDRAVKDCEIVFHVAGWLGKPNKRSAAYAIGVEATTQLAQAARSAGVQRFIYTSSIAVYGPTLDGVIEEDQPHQPAYLYAEIKSQGERAALDCATEKFGVTILRPAEVYGPRGGEWTTLPISLAKRGLPVLIAGGHGLTHPAYIDNLIDAYLAAALCPEAIGEAFTISDGDIEWREFFGRYALMTGHQPRSVPVALAWLGTLFAEIGAKLTRQPPIYQRSLIGFVTSRSQLSTAKAQRLLNWSPHISIDEGLRRTEEWLRAEKIL